MEAKLSNFGINRTSIWKTISVESAPGSSLAIHLAEVAEAVTQVVYATERPSHSQTHPHKSASLVLRDEDEMNSVNTHGVMELTLNTQEYQTHPACVPVVTNQFKVVKSVRLSWHHKDRA